MDESKTCTGCGETKPLSGFHKNAAAKDGLFSRCKACRRVEDAARYAASVNEAVRAEMRAKRRELVAAMSLEERAEVRRKNRDYMANRYSTDPAKRAEYMTAYRLANRQYFRDFSMRRRAKVAGVTVGPVDFDALWTGLCGICTLPIDALLSHPNPMSKSIDHIIAIANGGTHTQGNLQWAHLICNMRKGASTPK